MKTTLQNVVRVIAQKSENVLAFKKALIEYGVSKNVFETLGFNYAIEYSSNTIERVELFETEEDAKEALSNSVSTFEVFNDVKHSTIRDDGMHATVSGDCCSLIATIIPLNY